jgi:chaperonin cofactor prefoldin
MFKLKVNFRNRDCLRRVTRLD